MKNLKFQNVIIKKQMKNPETSDKMANPLV